MKKLSFLIVLFLFGALIVLNSCKKEDLIGPVVYLLGADSQILESDEADTVVLLYTKYVDPGVSVEDNVSEVEDIVVVSDIDDVLDFTDDGYLRRVEDVIITYSATDEALNVTDKERNISIRNISEPFAGVYTTERTALYIEQETTYNSTVAVDTRVPGRISFPKVYAHIESETDIDFKLVADLFDPEKSTSYSASIAYMGTSTDSDTPFFKDMTYTEGMDAALDFELLMISAQTFTDDLGRQFTISGVSDPSNVDLPYSRIEYLSGTTTIKRIVLELNVTRDGVSTDRVTEVYVPQ